MIKINELLYARMIKMLMEGCTAYNICDETGMERERIALGVRP